jgi:hypothetical protein
MASRAETNGTVMDEPEGLKAHGGRLWRSIVVEFDLDQHELILLEQCCRSADLVAALAAEVDRFGPLTDAGKVRPATVELRQQRIVLARLLAALRVPLADHDDNGEPDTDPVRRLQRRPTRGVYALGDAG